MITKLQIENFQVHEKLRIDCDKLTTINGTTERGKSSIVRALRWLSTNKPRGESFVRWGSNSVSVKAIVDGRRFSRSKKEGNQYRLDDQVFKAFGSDVPETIADFVNVSDDNFQMQHDSPFWFNLTSGEVAKRINDIVDLTVIDDSLSKISSMTRETNAEIKVCENRLEEANQKLERLNFVPKLVSDYNDITELEEKTRQLKESCLVLSNLSREVEELKEQETLLSDVVDCKSRLSTKYEEMSKLEDDANELQFLIASVERNQALQECDVPDFSKIEKLKEETKRAKESSKVLSTLISEIEELRRKTHCVKESKKAIQKQLDRIDMCPLCERKM